MVQDEAPWTLKASWYFIFETGFTCMVRAPGAGEIFLIDAFGTEAEAHTEVRKSMTESKPKMKRGLVRMLRCLFVIFVSSLTESCVFYLTYYMG